MTMKVTNDDGEEIEVYTAEEVTAREQAAVAPVRESLTSAEKALADRTREFNQARGTFEKLSEEKIAKLSETERILYERTEQLAKKEEESAAAAKVAYDAQVLAALKPYAGSDAKLLEELTKTWGVIGVEAKTPEQIEAKARMVAGALAPSSPSLLGIIGSFSGGAIPPQPKAEGAKTFADTEQGKAFGAELGLTLEAPKA